MKNNTHSSLSLLPRLLVLLLCLLLPGLLLPLQAQVNPADSLYIRQHYTKLERQIPMRDGLKLFTAIYVPKDQSRKYPILFTRTPYGVGPYGENAYKTSLGPSMHFAREGFIIVYQDVRGRLMSEGEFVAVRPYIPKKRKKTDVDESSDAHDTIAWLLKNVSGHNGNVGVWGGSAGGFYTTATLLDPHPALKATSPQAPVTDWFLGDDRHHNGAFMLMGTFSFLSYFGLPRPEPVPRMNPGFSQFGTPDGYRFYLEMGPLKNINKRIFQNGNALWNQIMEHGTYDDYWRARTLIPHLKKVKPAVLTIGGWFDQEDLYGPLKTYAALGRQSPKTDNKLVMGPWIHGGWVRSDGEQLGDISFGAKTSVFYREKIEFPFFMHHLKGTPDPQLPEAYIFETGSNQWRQYDQWPPKQTQEKNLYLHPGGRLSFEPPMSEEAVFDEYLSDPEKPVPYTSEIRIVRGSDYMYEDQRFAATRPDVLVYESEPLTEDVTVSGNVLANLFVSTTGTDADFVVKLIDVYPGDAPNDSPRGSHVKMGDFQLLVRGEVMRAKFRNSFAEPEPLVPNQVTEVRFDMQDAAHTFRRGHRIMVQVQSSWFPLVDRNPQTFVNIYEADEADFQKAFHRVYLSRRHPSHLKVSVLGK